MADAIAVLNAGSSSLKFSLFAEAGDGPVGVLRGQAEALQTSPRFIAKDAAGAVIGEKAWGDGVVLGHAGALDYLFAFLRDRLAQHRLVGIGHRVVHGGLEFAREIISMYRTAFPDIQFTVEEQVAEGDMVVTRWSARGTHLGTLRGIPPTGKQVTVTGMIMERYCGGRPRRSWMNWDGLGLMQQLGIGPSLAPRAGQ